MKRLLFLLIAFVAFAVNAQERIVNKTFTSGRTYYKYSGTTSDYVDGDTYDTLTFVMFLNKDYPIQVYTRSDLSLVGTADTTLSITLDGKVFSDEDWTNIASDTRYGTADTSSVLSTDDLSVYTLTSIALPTYNLTGGDTSYFSITFDTTAVSSDSIGYYSATVKNDSISTSTATAASAGGLVLNMTKNNVYQFYRYIRLQYIIAGNDLTGTGIRLNDIEFKLIDNAY